VKIIWLSPFPVDMLVPFGLDLIRPAGGHACSWIVNWAKPLAALVGFDLRVITLSPRVRTHQSIKYEGYTVDVLRSAIPLTSCSMSGFANLDARSGFYFQCRLLAARISELGADVVHGHGTEDAYGLAASCAQVPSVISIQGVMGEYLKVDPSPRRKFTAAAEKRAIRRCHNFMARTHFDKHYVQIINPSARIYHMAEPMNPCFFDVQRRPADPPRILYVGGFDVRKNLDDMLVAFAGLSERFPHLQLDVVGGGSRERESQLKAKSESMRIGSRVHFLGRLPPERIAELHSLASVYVITSTIENSPNALMEALCAGTPSVAFDVGGIASMFTDGKSGFLVPARDTRALAERIATLLENADIALEFSRRSRELAEANRPHNVAQQSLKVYRAVAEGSPEVFQ
jgi:glycosyltransferase involved in cell wall biosynthesis